MAPRPDHRPPPPGRHVPVNGIRWHVEEAGDQGPGLLLFHGYLGSSAGWRRALPALGRHFRVAAVDLPGAGYSDRPGNLPYDLHWFAHQVPALISALGFHRPFMGGHSFGSSIAIHAAARHATLARGLVLVAPLVYRQLPPPGLRLAKRYPGIAGHFFASALGRKVIPFLVRNAAYARKGAKVSTGVQRLIEHLDAPGGWEAATRMGLLAGETMPTALELDRIHCPTILFWGRHDPVHPVAHATEVAQDLRGPCTTVILEHSAHNCHEEEWQTLVAKTIAWSQRV
jgi:pimeloyl-ACP methyl ester carboxylesterase